MNQNLLSVNDLSDVLNVPPSWIYQRTRQTGPDTIPKIKVGKYIRFQLEEVMDWLRAQGEAE